MKRREFIGFVGGAAAWPVLARAQPAVPLVGFLRNSSPEASAHLSAAFRQGLSESGFTEGRDVAIESRWARGQHERLQILAAELVRLGTAVIFAGSTAEALAAKAATNTIPIVFTGAADPVKVGLVGALNRPGGNITGVTAIGHSLGAKRLELLRQLVPHAATIALLVNQNNPSVETEVLDTQQAARAIGLQMFILNASNERESEAAITTAVQKNASAVVIAGDPLFTGHRNRLAELALQHKLPTIYALREYVVSGGLVSYGASFADSYRQCGIYVARILKGENPGDLPIMQPTRFEFVISAKTAKLLGLDVPVTLLATADEVIE